MGNDYINPNLGALELREALYDTLSYAKGAALPTTLAFFTHTISVNGAQVTNMKKANELPAGEAMDVYRVRIGFRDVAAADLLAIKQLFAVVMKVAGKEVLRGPIEMFPGGGSFESTAAFATFDIPEDLVHKIPPSTTFNFELVGAGYTLLDATLGVDIVAMLDGIHAVPRN
ncbi:MAG: hypothetical protein LAQ30_01610 [Acidobacteriia bacterium]|nr:hypothetical protein [Terriglobia bacterium]